LLGDELDSPRGRIYLIKEMLEGNAVTEKTQLHLDRCLTCRSCETTCPSGVEYGKLVDIGRHIVEERVGRRPLDVMKRKLMRSVIPHPGRFRFSLSVARLLRPLLPQNLARKIPRMQSPAAWPTPRHTRRMLVLDGCAQPSLAPDINGATARLLDRIGISLVRAEKAGCCGAVSYHLNAQQEGLDFMRRNIDAWWPAVEAGAEAIVMTASGCGTTVKEYGHLLARDPAYADKAKRVSALTRDLSEIIAQESPRLAPLFSTAPGRGRKIAFHAPCSLQHGQKIRGKVESLLTSAGFSLTPVPDGHLCCGSAGTYSITQPELAQQLLTNKVTALQSGSPELIATANIGCLTHLQSGTGTPVLHWVEVLERSLSGKK
jgi:glycolate oxidase iron-sulfur subunit